MTLNARQAEHALTHIHTHSRTWEPQFMSHLAFPFFSCFTHTNTCTRELPVACCVYRETGDDPVLQLVTYSMTSQRGCELFLVLNTERERAGALESGREWECHESAHTHTHTPATLLRDAYCRPKHTNVDYAIKCLSRSRSFTLVRYLRAYGGSLRFIFIPLQGISVWVCVGQTCVCTLRTRFESVR